MWPRVRRLAEASESVIVFTGPVFCDATERIGEGQVAVPCRFFKIALAVQGGRMRMFAAVLPNEGNPRQSLTEFAAAVAEVERATDLDFFPHLPPVVQGILEAAREPLPE